jgi:hypothetical protein
MFLLAIAEEGDTCQVGLTARIRGSHLLVPARGELGLEEAFIDVSFAGAKRSDRIGPTRCSKWSRITAIADGHGLIAVWVTSSSPDESTLVEDTLGGLPNRLSADRAYDSDRADERLRQEHSLQLIVPNRGRRKRTQDGRPLRRYAALESGASVMPG